MVAIARPGAERWYAKLCATRPMPGADTSPAEATMAALPPALLEEICAPYWDEREPLVHVLDRLAFARIPPSNAPHNGVVTWPENADPGSLTAAVDGAALLTGPWEPQLMLNRLLGVPTLAITTPA